MKARPTDLGLVTIITFHYIVHENRVGKITVTKSR